MLADGPDDENVRAETRREGRDPRNEAPRHCAPDLFDRHDPSPPRSGSNPGSMIPATSHSDSSPAGSGSFEKRTLYISSASGSIAVHRRDSLAAHIARKNQYARIGEIDQVAESPVGKRDAEISHLSGGKDAAARAFGQERLERGARLGDLILKRAMVES